MDQIRYSTESTCKPGFVCVCVFQGFNDGLDELCKIQQGWAVPDKEQRDAIRQAQKRVVSEAYRAFLQRWDLHTHLPANQNTAEHWAHGYMLLQMREHLLHQKPREVPPLLSGAGGGDDWQALWHLSLGHAHAVTIATESLIHYLLSPVRRSAS